MALSKVIGITMPYCPFDKNQNAETGEILTFGTYPQTMGGADKTPIKWRILENSGTELFLLSEDILDCRRYHFEYVDITWRDCELRKWLGNEFFDTAFDAAEQRFIQTTYCTDNGENSPNTEDKVFLLGIAEVKRLTGRNDRGSFAAERRAAGTDFAKMKKTDGCLLYVYDKSVPDDYITKGGSQHGCSWWWLRTQLSSRPRAAFIGTRASIRSYGRVSLKFYGVRPALKLRLQS